MQFFRDAHVYLFVRRSATKRIAAVFKNDDERYIKNFRGVLDWFKFKHIVRRITQQVEINIKTIIQNSEKKMSILKGRI